MSQKFCEKKLKKPCGECPFTRVNGLSKPYPGNNKPEVYLGQARGPFWLPCHCDKNYAEKESNPATVTECAGASIFRANTGPRYKLPAELLALEADHDLVFSNEAQFFAHYYGITEEHAQSLLTEQTLDQLMKKEMSDINLKTYD